MPAKKRTTPKPYSSRTMRPDDWARLKHFTPAEFKFPNLMGFEFMLWLEARRDNAGVPFIVSSDHRTPAQNQNVGGATDSAHMDIPTDCVDLVPVLNADDPHGNYARFVIVEELIAGGAKRIGIYANGSIHVDRTEWQRPAPRLWVMVD